MLLISRGLWVQQPHWMLPEWCCPKKGCKFNIGDEGVQSLAPATNVVVQAMERLTKTLILFLDTYERYSWSFECYSCTCPELHDRHISSRNGTVLMERLGTEKFLTKLARAEKKDWRSRWCGSCAAVENLRRLAALARLPLCYVSCYPLTDLQEKVSRCKQRVLSTMVMYGKESGFEWNFNFTVSAENQKCKSVALDVQTALRHYHVVHGLIMWCNALLQINRHARHPCGNDPHEPLKIVWKDIGEAWLKESISMRQDERDERHGTAQKEMYIAVIYQSPLALPNVREFSRLKTH